MSVSFLRSIEMTAETISLISFKKTKSMAALLDERSKRQKEKRNTSSAKEVAASKDASEGKSDLMRLVESVKRKSAAVDAGSGKRRKV